MSEKKSSAEGLGILLALIAAFGFSAKAVLVKLAYALPQATPVDPVTLLALRMVFSLPAFAWVGLRASRGAPPLTGRQWAGVVVLGLLGYYGASILDFIGLGYISAGLERLILFTYPTLTLMIGAVMFGKRITGRQIAALVLCYLGITFAFLHDVKLSGAGNAIWIGAAFVFGSSLCYAFYLSGSGQMIARLGSARFTALAMLVSTLATFAHFLVTQPVKALVQPWPVYGLGAAMAVFSTIIPVFAQGAAIRRIGSGPAALIGTIGPMLTIALGWWLLNEPISMAQILGAGLVVAGVVLVGRERKV